MAEPVRLRLATPPPPAAPRPPARVIPAQPRIVAPIRWSFYAFILSMPVEAVRFFGSDVTTFSLSKAFGYLFFGCLLLQVRTIFRRPPVAVYCFCGYVASYAALLLLEPGGARSGSIIRLIQIMQMIVLLWAATPLLARPDIRFRAVTAFVAGSTLLALTQQYAPQATDDPTRVTALGENPNTIGAVMALAITAIVGLTRERQFRSPFMKTALIAMVPILLYHLVKTGSRTAFLALAAGLLTYLLATRGIGARFKAALVLTIVAVAGAVVMSQAGDLRERLRLSIEEGNLARREEIFPAAAQMFLDRPILGWGPGGHERELGDRLGDYRETEEHNLVLFILCEGGLFEGLPYFAGALLCVAAAWRARRRGNTLAPALLIVLFLVNMANVFDNRKIHWLFLALALGSARIEQPLRRRGAAPRRSPVLHYAPKPA